MRPLHTLLALLVAVLVVPGMAAADPAVLRGAALANACAACHGPNGRSQGAIPSINALSAEDFIAALKAFRAETRPGTVMNRIAKGLDEADITALVAYFATLQKR
jgi:sulfide dehydrogenase cytochrome subunit